MRGERLTLARRQSRVSPALMIFVLHVADLAALSHLKGPAHTGCDEIFLDLSVHTSCTRGLL